MAANPRTIAFTLNGQTFQIPELWIVGRQRAHADLTPIEAYHAACLDWVVQEQLAEQHAHERTRVDRRTDRA